MHLRDQLKPEQFDVSLKGDKFVIQCVHCSKAWTWPRAQPGQKDELSTGAHLQLLDHALMHEEDG